MQITTVALAHRAKRDAAARPRRANYFDQWKQWDALDFTGAPCRPLASTPILLS